MYKTGAFLKQKTLDVATGIIPYNVMYVTQCYTLSRRIMRYNWQQSTSAAKTVIGWATKMRLY